MRSLIRAMVVLALSSHAWSGSLAAEDADPPLAPDDDVERRLNEERLAEIIERVREYERLYANIDFTVRRSYRYFQRVDAADRKLGLLFGDGIERFIHQGNLFYMHSTFHGQAPAGKWLPSGTLEAAYDGRQTTFLQDSFDALAKIHDSRVPPYFTKHAHTLSFAGDWYQGTLSQYLASPPTSMGRTAMRRYVGTAEVDELECDVIEIQWRNPDGGLSSGAYMWLAKDRNYIPVRYEGTQHPYERHIPELIEIEPGTWFPRKVVEMQYYVEKGVRVLHGQNEYETLRVSLNPDYPASLFQQIRIPSTASSRSITTEKSCAGTTMTDDTTLTRTPSGSAQ